MNKKEATQRIRKLRESIRVYREAVHERDESLISEEALDSLKHELSLLEQEYPDLVTSDSPTQKIAGTVLDTLNKTKHAFPQWSLNDVFSEEELLAFDERVKKMLTKAGVSNPTPSYACELKIDGLHLVLTYEQGELKTAATRGDGEYGEEVTHTVRTIASLPTKLKEPIDLVVEGEAFLSRSGFKVLNKERKKNNEPEFANPRNAVAGSLRQLDSSVAASRPIGMFVYDIDASPKDLKTQIEEISYLHALSLPVEPHRREVKTLSEIIAFWKKWQGSAREELDYQIDGMVVKVNEIAYQKILGYTGKAPRFAVAFKFPAEQVTTIIQDIVLQVGRTGVLTPVAHVLPVSVSGSTVSRATLHNADFIQQKDIRIGDTVILQKAGDIIPEIVRVLPEFRSGKEKVWKFPAYSPLCAGDGRVERVPGQAAYRCAVRGSYAELLRKITHFTSKSALDIDGCGKKTVQLLLDNELISDASDLFELTNKDLLELPGFKQKSASNLLMAIEEKRRVPLDRFLVSLSIPHLGEESARLIALHFSSLSAIEKASISDFEKINGIGSIMAQALYDWFNDEREKEFLNRLKKHIQTYPLERAMSEVLKGELVVITGSLEHFSRNDAENMVRKAGGGVAKSVSRATTLLIQGVGGGVKSKEARELGIPIISESEFMEKIRNVLE